jgi:putative transposase
LTLAAFVGETVTIRYDPRDLAEIRVFHRGEFLCKAVSPELAAVSISMKDLQAARNQRRRELGQQLLARRSVVDILTEPQPVPVSPLRTPGDKARPEPVRIKLYRED